MDTYHVVLYLHLLSLLIGIGAGSILLVCIFQLRNAQTLADAIPWGRVAGKVGRAFPIAVLGLFATGAYMTSDIWTWDTGWIYVSIVGLAVVTLQGPIVAERTAHKLRGRAGNGPGPLGEQARRMTRHPGLWVAEFTNLALVLGIVWNMTQKPGDRERCRHPRRRLRRRCGWCALVLSGARGRAGSGDGADRLARLPEGRTRAGPRCWSPSLQCKALIVLVV